MNFLSENWLTLILLGAAIYMMVFRKGGCCGGTHNHKNHK